MKKKKSQNGVTCLKKADLNHTIIKEYLEFTSKPDIHRNLAGSPVKRTF